MIVFTPGKVVVGVPFRCLALDWKSMPIAELPQKRTDETLAVRGLYAFDGRHDAHANGCILYLGESGHRDDSARTIGQRAFESFKRFAWDTNKASLFSDVWDVTLRWASIDASEDVRVAEQVLIAAHAPPFNNHHVRQGLPPDHHDFIVLNAGQKGRLLPVVVGAHYCAECWSGAE